MWQKSFSFYFLAFSVRSYGQFFSARFNDVVKIAHCSILKPVWISRAKKHSFILTFQPYFFISTLFLFVLYFFHYICDGENVNVRYAIDIIFQTRKENKQHYFLVQPYIKILTVHLSSVMNY